MPPATNEWMEYLFFMPELYQFLISNHEIGIPLHL